MGYREKWFSNNNSNHGWYTCISCGKNFRKGDIDIDHIIPQNHGGTDDLDNLQCMCKHCNRSKQDDTKFTDEDIVGNITGVRIGTHDDITNLDNILQRGFGKSRR